MRTEPSFLLFSMFSYHKIEVFFSFEDHKDAVATKKQSGESPKQPEHVEKDGDGEENASKAEEGEHEKKENQEDKEAKEGKNSNVASEESVDKNVNKGNKDEEENDKNDVNEEENETKPVAQKQSPSAQKSSGKEGKGTAFKLSAHPSCRDDVKQLCSSVPKENNFAILICLQDSAAVSCIFYLFL